MKEKFIEDKWKNKGFSEMGKREKERSNRGI